jgi:cytochrome c oxidase subunit 4
LPPQTDCLASFCLTIKMLLRSLPQIGRHTSTSSTCLSASQRTASLTRSFHSTPCSAAATFDSSQQRPYPVAPTSSTHPQSRSAHAISNPTLAGIEKRWQGMPPQEQAVLWMQLRDRMKVDWHEMTLQEKKAGM